MDAPEISTLREDSSPPAPARTSVSSGKLKLKLNLGEPSASKPEPLPALPKSAAEDGEDDMEDEPEDQEDQLIDDDDESPPSHANGKRKSPAKARKPRKSRPAEDVQELSAAGPTLSWIEEVSSAQFEQPGPSHPDKQPPAAGQKRKAVKKPAGAPKAKRAKRTTALPILTDDADLMSEGHTGSAASSPITAPFDGHSSDAEPDALSLDPLVTGEEGPHPVYPLPTKPFPVQPPPKMPTGFAPVIPLDRSGKRCRKWRTANREIRGIAGGRWFARSWVGEKEIDATVATLPDKEETGSTASLALSRPHGLSKMRGVVAVGPASEVGGSDLEQ